MRKLILKSENSEIDLTSKTYFFNRPQGFGFTFSNEYFRVGNTQKITKQLIELPTITGDVCFLNRNTQHRDFKNFIDFISLNTLQIVYMPADDEFIIDVTVEAISKGEIELNGMLVCPITIRALGLWKKTTPLQSLAIAPLPNNSFTYPYSYDYVYSSTNGSFVLATPGGHFDADIIAYISGACTNPKLIGTVDGIEVFNVTLTGSLSEGEVLIYDSTDGNEKVSVDGVSVIADVDITKNIFGKVPKGKSVKIELITDSGSPTMDLFVNEYFKAV